MNKVALSLLCVVLLMVAVQAAPEAVYKSFQSNDFNSLDGWFGMAPLKPNTFFSTCGGVRLAGGYGVFGKQASLVRQFRLPPHWSVRVQVQFWKIDSWDNEIFYLWVDDKIIYQKNFQHNEGDMVCGTQPAWKSLKQDLDFTVPHNGNTATVVFTTNLDEDANNESFAIRDFVLSIERCPDGCDTCKSANKEDCMAWETNSWFWIETDNLSAQGWNVEKARDGMTSCAGVVMYGGYNLFGAGALIRNQVQLKPHYKLKFKFLLFKIDSWDNEKAWLTVDNKEVWGQNFQYNQGYKNSICGTAPSDWAEMAVNVEVEVNHTWPTADLVFTSNLNEAPDNESWGIRDFYVYQARCAARCVECTGPLGKDCTKCEGAFAIQNGQCAPLVNFILLEQSFLDKTFTGINDWTIEKAKAGSAQNYICNGVTLVGGYNIFGAGATATKTFTIPPHKRLRVTMQLWKIDSWDDEWFWVNVDGGRIFEKQLGFASGGTKLCGSANAGWLNTIVQVDQIFFHSTPTAQVKIGSTLDQAADDESWGFREFRIFYEAKPDCAVFYTECNYQGAQFEFCGDSNDFRNDNLPPQIRSIKLPPQGRVTLYQNKDFGGKSVTYTTSQECIQAYNFQFLQLSAKFHQEEKWVEVAQGNNLRKQI